LRANNPKRLDELRGLRSTANHEARRYEFGQPALAFADSVLWREFGLAAQSKSYGVCMRRSHCGEFLLPMQQSATALLHSDTHLRDGYKLRWIINDARCGLANDRKCR